MAELFTVQAAGQRIDLEHLPDVPPPTLPSLELLKYFFIVRGKAVLDLGCGTGLFAIAAAKMGASEVWATDINPAAVDCTRRNANRNGVEIVAKSGDLFAPVEGRMFDLIITNPPQTPGPPAAPGPKFAGEDGLLFMSPLIKQAPAYLEKGGELLTMLISLADTRQFESRLSERFRFRTLPKSRREFTREEYDAIRPGLFDFLADRRARGLAEYEDENGRHSFSVRYYMAMIK